MGMINYSLIYFKLVYMYSNYIICNKKAFVDLKTFFIIVYFLN